MPTSWPTSLDSFGTVTSVELLGTANTAGLTHSQLHNLETSAIAAIETSMQQWANGAITQDNTFSGANTFTTGVTANKTGSNGTLVGAHSGAPSTSGYTSGDFAIDPSHSRIWGFDGTTWNQLTPPSGCIMPYAGITVPNGDWLLCDGSTYTRSTLSALWSAISIQQTGTTSSGSNAITGLSDTSNMGIGMPINGPGLAATGVTIASITSSTAITVSTTASTGFGTGAVVVAPWGLGNGTTTFNVPDLRSRMPLGAGTGSGLTARVLGISSGSETTVHNHPHTGTHQHPHATTHSHTLGAAFGELQQSASGIWSHQIGTTTWTATVISTGQTTVGDSTSRGAGIAIAGSTDAISPGTSDLVAPGSTDNATPSIMPPFQVVNYIIKT